MNNMFEMKKLYLLAACLSVAIISCQKQGPTKLEEEIVEEEEVVTLPKTRLSLDETKMKNIGPSNDFTFKYFLDNYRFGESLLLSPLGIQTTAAMIGNYVKDHTMLAKMLAFGNVGMDEVNDYFKNLITDLSGERFNKELTFATALMTDSMAKKYPEDFIGVLKSFYLADYLEFTAKSLVEQPVGSRPEDVWCAEKTNGMISSAPYPVEAGESSLFSAICFKGEWKDKFDKNLTAPQQFLQNAEEWTLMPMMHKVAKINYYKCDDFNAVSLPFGDGTFELSVILPAVPFNIYGLLKTLDESVWDKMRHGMVNKDINLSIPCFSASSTHQELLIYERGNDVGGACVLGQKATFKMDEDGASAAAVTQSKALMAPVHGEKEIVSFLANSPFVYTISEAGSGLILFIGVFSGV